MFGSSLGQLGRRLGVGGLELGEVGAVGAGRRVAAGGGVGPRRSADEGRTRHATGHNLTPAGAFRVASGLHPPRKVKSHGAV